MTQVVTHAPNGWPALVLNADFRPLSYYPLSLWPWQEVVKSVFLERVDVVAEYDEFVHSPSITMRLPSVIALREFVKQDRQPAFTRFNVFLRDKFECQYCGDHDDLTFDHVTPRLAAEAEKGNGHAKRALAENTKAANTSFSTSARADRLAQPEQSGSAHIAFKSRNRCSCSRIRKVRNCSCS